MIRRSFGWVQEAYKLDNLKRVIQLFVLDSDVNILLRSDKIPRLIDEKYGKRQFIEELEKNPVIIPYMHLKGRGTPKGYTRATAPCSGIVQAVLPGQRKEYQSDWPADSYLRWAISIGFLKYNYKDDTCQLSELGLKYAQSVDKSVEEYNILTEALLSNPPVCRVLTLLDNACNNHMSKFEMGSKLGFIGENGFTSIPQSLLIQALAVADDSSEKNKILQDTEGTSDKYVRTICSWLIQMGWVRQVEKEFTVKIGSKKHTDSISQSYMLTLEGKKQIKRIKGTSKYKKVEKNVYWEMLSTKPSDKYYLRNRRTHIIQYVVNKPHTLIEIKNYLKEQDYDEELETIKDDLNSFEAIGLNIQIKNDLYYINDIINNLIIPQEVIHNVEKSELSNLKDELRRKLITVDHKYLQLLDLSFDGKSNQDFELQTAELLLNELNFDGAHLGGSRKPDICVYYGMNGLIIDNKAYSGGYTIPIGQADEMYRYIEDNINRDINVNPNKWWEIFDDNVKIFNFVFISGNFKGEFKDKIHNLNARANIDGSVINSYNLLLLAEKLKSKGITYEKCFEYFSCNDEIILN